MALKNDPDGVDIFQSRNSRDLSYSTQVQEMFRIEENSPLPSMAVKLEPVFDIEEVVVDTIKVEPEDTHEEAFYPSGGTVEEIVEPESKRIRTDNDVGLVDPLSEAGPNQPPTKNQRGATNRTTNSSILCETCGKEFPSEDYLRLHTKCLEVEQSSLQNSDKDDSALQNTFIDYIKGQPVALYPRTEEYFRDFQKTHPKITVSELIIRMYLLKAKWQQAPRTSSDGSADLDALNTFYPRLGELDGIFTALWGKPKSLPKRSTVIRINRPSRSDIRSPLELAKLLAAKYKPNNVPAARPATLNGPATPNRLSLLNRPRVNKPTATAPVAKAPASTRKTVAAGKRSGKSKEVRRRRFSSDSYKRRHSTDGTGGGEVSDSESNRPRKSKRNRPLRGLDSVDDEAQLELIKLKREELAYQAERDRARLESDERMKSLELELKMVESRERIEMRRLEVELERLKSQELIELKKLEMEARKLVF